MIEFPFISLKVTCCAQKNKIAFKIFMFPTTCRSLDHAVREGRPTRPPPLPTSYALMYRKYDNQLFEN